MRAGWPLLLLLLVLPHAALAAPPAPSAVVAGAWLEGREGRETLVVALYRRAGSAGPAKAFVGCSVGTDQDLPGGYGTIPIDAWTEVALDAGVLVRAERALRPEEHDRPPAVLVLPQAASASIEVHPLVNGSVPAEALLFARPTRSSVVALAQHVLEIGSTTTAELAAPPPTFLLPETLEVAVVSRELGMDRQDPEAEGGHVRLVWLPLEGPPPAPAQELSGEAGERRIRAHFSDPKCAWAERHVGWMASRWVLEYVRATPLRFRVETDAVKRAGLVSDLWKGYGALCVEGIYPNGFGGSSANYDLPPLLIVPKDTATRTVPLR